MTLYTQPTFLSSQRDVDPIGEPGLSSVGWEPAWQLAARELLNPEDSILDPVERQLMVGGRRIDPTPLEFELLDFLYQRQGKVVDRSTLLRDVWGSHVGSNVIDTVVRSLRKQLGEQASMIETVRGRGYRLRAEAA